MDADLKKILKAVVLEMRHELEGYYDKAQLWHPGDLEQRLAEIGVRKDRESVPVDELQRLTDEDKRARSVVDAYVRLRENAGEDRATAVTDFVRESAYTWANRLLALRCMEARELIDEAILQKQTYGGRSLEHHRLAQRQPELCAGEDDGLFAMLEAVFAEQTARLPMLFDLQSPGIALRPTPTSLKKCIAWLSGTATIRSVAAATDEVFSAPDALGWAYQYWNTEEKDRVFETVRTKKGAKIEGADIIPATQLYTEDYMVKFLVQNSLGATWMGMHPESQLFEGWEYYVRDADRAPVTQKPLSEITLLDPACGSGHFLIEAFDLFYAMYEEEGTITEPELICQSILTSNLFGIDIDERAIQIAEAALWMKAEERAMGFSGATTNLVAATSSHLRGPSWEKFLGTLKNEPSTVRVLRRFATEIEHIDELGSLARPGEALDEIVKEEHEIWERQQRERYDAPSLFKEIRDDMLASQLPFQDISDEEFQARTMRHALFAIDGFTRDARESGDFNDQLIGAEAKAGFRLLELLSRKYDVVVANPPYMGSKNMGSVLKKHIEVSLKHGKRDLYSSFMIRALQLASPNARVAVIVPQTWMFLGSFSELRIGEQKDPSNKSDFIEKNGIVGGTKIEALCQLGRHAFSEADPPNNVAMSVFANCAPDAFHRITGIRITMSCLAEMQAKLLLDSLSDLKSELVSRSEQVKFLDIPESPLVYWLSKPLHNLLAFPKYRFSDVATTRYGMNTGNNDRFVRLFWETVKSGKRWVPYAKAGGYSKWAGMEWYLLEWEKKGARIRSTGTAKVQNSQFYFEEGVTYTLMARGAFGVRRLPANVAFDSASLSMFPLKKEVTCLNHILAISNCRATSYMLRVLAADIKFNPGYVDRAPFMYPKNKIISGLVDAVVALKTQEISLVPTERSYDIEEKRTSNLRLAFRHLIEGEIERVIFQEFGLTDEDIAIITSETGTPAAWNPLIDVHAKMLVSKLVADSEDLGLDGSVVAEILNKTPTINLDPEQFQELKNAIRCAFEHENLTSESSESSGGELEDAEENEIAASYMPIPCETLIEDFSNRFNIHPVSIAAIVDEGIANEGWQRTRHRQLSLEIKVSVAAIRLLGYLWPSQIDTGHCTETWTDDDGIVPLTEVNKESPIQSRVSARLREEEVDVRDFQEVMGKSLDDWLTAEFFKHHTKQFKKRPIAWQLQTASFTARNTPAFACLVYYHKVDVDTIPKIRSQYLGPLRGRLETELRGITNLTSENRSEKQLARLPQLEDALGELQTFDTALQAIATHGFCPAALLPKLRQYAFDDAMLSLKAGWLRRLSGLVETKALAGWQTKATASKLHPELANWIADAMLHLDHHCATVSPKAPDAKKTEVDPTSANFAKLIGAKASSMLSDSLGLACSVWWENLEEAVFKPLKIEIKDLKAEQKEATDRTKHDEDLSQDDFYHLKERIKQIKATLKTLTADLKQKTAAAQKIRTEIAAWRSDEPAKWTDWLAGQPLFDQISSIDDRRTPPKTIGDFIAQESLYAPDINDGVRVNIAPLQKAGILAADVLATKDLDKAIADRAEWRADERRWVREGKLPQPGWWPEVVACGAGSLLVKQSKANKA